MAGSASDMADELERLAALHRSGVLTDEEFSAQKAKVLSPQPGVAEPDKKKTGNLVGGLIVLAVIGFGVYKCVDSEYPEIFMAGLPQCNTAAARKMVERTVAENSTGLAQGRKIIDWISDDSTARPTSTAVECHARVALNDGSETGMTYSFKERGDDILINVEGD